MTKIKTLVTSFALVFFLHGCSQILEPVSLFDVNKDVTKIAKQEEFEISIKSLTFNAAKEANNAPYPRLMIQSGSGSKANVLDEARFLESNFPELSKKPHYHLGVGDHISFTLLDEFKDKIIQWPSVPKETEYSLGVGDKLTFTQSIEGEISFAYSDERQLLPTKDTDSLIQTEGVIGSNGNILLFGLGNIQAANRTLNNIRTEVRNILIRNGQSPNFQLEISDFNSKKAFVTTSTGENETISLNNLPITLDQVALYYGISESDENFSLIMLSRNNQKFRFTAGQLFNSKAPEIIIQNFDQIKIQFASKRSTRIESIVGSKGNILLDGIGSIYALGRTLEDIYEEIRNTLIDNGTVPSFQLEVTKFTSKKAYLIQKNAGSTVIPLTSTVLTLRKLILENKLSQGTPSSSLSIVILKRNNQVFRMTEEQILDPKTQDIWILDNDQIEIKSLIYKPGQVFALSGAGRAHSVSINPSKRENLADILFDQNGVLNNLLAKRSEVYLLRGQSPSVAYHLDAQNVSRILVAAKTELRPNDIIYVADRPIVSFSRTLAEIMPLRILLRDIKDNNIP